MDAAERRRRLRTFEADHRRGGCRPIGGNACPHMVCVCSSWRPTRYERVLLGLRRVRRRLVRFLFAP